MMRVDAIVAAAPETEALLHKLGITEYCVIPLAIDEQALCPGMDPGPVVEELDLHPGDGVVTFVGRLNEFKDPLALVRAAPIVLAKRPHTHFVIVGDGPLSADLHTAVVDLDLQHAVRLVGARSDVGRFLTLSDVFTALSPVENAWSMTIAEAMHMHIPCIITCAGHTERLFTHMEDSLLIPPGDEQALADAILQLLDSKRDRDRLVRGALTLMKRHGKDANSIAQRHLDLYESVRRE
jgi:glycosyltransferase involved in cell wall biosynthesis